MILVKGYTPLSSQDDFCKLTNLVSIDLSNNLIKELPSDFGGLQRLQKIDLYNNKLNSLPVSFCYFKNLKWLDLKVSLIFYQKYPMKI